jgi:hypothetical protein
MRLIAFITTADAITAMLVHLGEPTTDPPLAPRVRQELDFTGGELVTLDQSPRWDPNAAPADPGYGFDQTTGA